MRSVNSKLAANSKKISQALITKTAKLVVKLNVALASNSAKTAAAKKARAKKIETLQLQVHTVLVLFHTSRHTLRSITH